MDHSNDEIKILAVSQFEQDHTALRGILGSSRWKIDTARSVREAAGYLACRPVPVILCEKNLPDGTWTDVLERSQMTALVIVTFHAADERLRTEVLCCGGYYVLSKPFRAADVFQAISNAWRHSKDKNALATAAAKHYSPAAP